MNLARFLHAAAASDATAPAIAFGAAPYASYVVLARRVSALAGALRAHYRLAAGERVGLAMTNTPVFIEVLFACWHAGLAAVPINAKLHPSEIRYILEHSGARLVFATPALADALAGTARGLGALRDLIDTGPAAAASPAYRRLLTAPPMPMVDVADDALAWLFYTSGTTGRPKGAMLSHRNLRAMTLSYFADVDRIAPGDAILHAAPMSHGSGLYILPHVAAGAVQVVPESGRFDPQEIGPLLDHHRGVALFAAPTMVKRLLEAPGQAMGLKTIVYGGGPMYRKDLAAAMERFEDRLVQIYGQGESPMTITALSRADHARREHPRYDARLASVGRAQSVVEVQVVDDDDRSLDAGATGEVVVRGDAVMLGYWQDDAATKRTLRGGWLHTGDLGTFDDDGYLTLKDRSKDLIISGGSNIYPREVEDVLQSHPGVSECAVVGAPHPEWGEAVVAFVVPTPALHVTAEDLDALCLAHLARFKRPRRYRLVEALPKNNYGKILKTELRAWLDPSAAR